MLLKVKLNNFKSFKNLTELDFNATNYKILNDQNKIAVIGARKASNYGINIARQIGKFLSKNNIHTISGLALGIDVNSHIGVLTENYINSYSGKAIAVIGNGLDNIYPYNNQEIANRIINNGGCIISEYPNGTIPLKEHFPERNRLISGLSKGVLITESTIKSGTSITTNCALEQNREVYVLPGSMFNDMTMGNLISAQEGAKIVISAKDIIDDFN